MGQQAVAGGAVGGATPQAAASVMPQMLTTLNAILVCLQGGVRDRTIIRESVEAIGVA
jgi:hypothetical protein